MPIPAETWTAIRRKGLLPGINTSDEYEKKVMVGMTKAAEWLLGEKEKPPSLATARKIHSLTFKEVAPFAGKLTKVPLITNGYITCDPSCIQIEFALLEKQLRDGLPKNANDQETCRWIAFAAARWLRIHPFADGNKRTISLWALSILQPRFQAQSPGFFRQLKASFKELRKGNLEPFGAALLQACQGKPNPEHQYDWTLPHKVAPTQPETSMEI